MAQPSASQKEQSVIHNTFVIERNFPQSPERVFAAFADPAKKRRWFAEGDNHNIEQFEQDFREGGSERLSYRFKEGTMFPGVVIGNESVFQDIIQNQRIVTASAMTFAGKRISATLVTIELLPSGTGTDMICTHQGAFFEGSGGPELRQSGWRSLFDKLAKVLDTE